MPVTATTPVVEIEDTIEIPMLYSKETLYLMVGGVCLTAMGLLGGIFYAFFM